MGFRRLLTAGMVLASLVGCNYKPEERVGVLALSGNEARDTKGGIGFTYKGITYRDEGFDGTLNQVIFYNSKHERVVLSKGDIGFEEHIPGYLKAREKATKGEWRGK